MKKTALTIFGALLISGLAVQMAAASTHHHQHLTKANFSRHHSDFRGAYNRVSGPISVGPIQPLFQPAPFNDDWDYVIGKPLDSHSGD